MLPVFNMNRAEDLDDAFAQAARARADAVLMYPNPFFNAHRDLLVTPGRAPSPADAAALRSATLYATIALLPFAAALGLSFYVIAGQLWDGMAAAMAGVVAFAVSFIFGLDSSRAPTATRSASNVGAA